MLDSLLDGDDDYYEDEDRYMKDVVRKHNTESIGRWQDALSLRTDQLGVLDIRVEENEAKLRPQAAPLDEQVQRCEVQVWSKESSRAVFR